LFLTEAHVARKTKHPAAGLLHMSCLHVHVHAHVDVDVDVDADVHVDGHAHAPC
jgi:hypothetical protein